MITAEGEKLGRHWTQYGQDYLDSYLIQNVEHPSINPQSILIRAFVIDLLFPGKFTEIIEEELFFSACACHALQAYGKGRLRDVFEAVRGNHVNAAIPPFLHKGFRTGRSHIFDCEQLIAELAKCITLGFEYFRSPFQGVWRERLRGRSSAAPRMIELGCGSANDYRFWDEYGMASHVEYIGLDVCEANIRNAKSRFPGVRFLAGDACCTGEDDMAFDVVFVFDLLEHFSPEALDAALMEIARLSRDEVWLSFFNATDAVGHDFQAVGDYYWNTLSLPDISKNLHEAGFLTETVSIAGELEHRFPGYSHYNRNVHIMIGKRKPSSGNR